MNRGLGYLIKYEDDIREKKANCDFSLCGVQGYCFIEKDKIIKIYDNAFNCSDLSAFSSPRISFPISYIIKNDVVCGEIMPYFRAFSIYDSLQDNTNVKKLFDSYKEIIKEIKRFPNIFMVDLSFPNILYNENSGFYLIDTTRWYVSEDNYERNNIRAFDSSLFSILSDFFCEISVKQELSDIKDGFMTIRKLELGKEFLRLYELLLRRIDFQYNDFMSIYQELVRIYYNDEVETLSDVKKYTKILKSS